MLTTLHHVGEERTTLYGAFRAGIDVDRRQVEVEVRAARVLAEGTAALIAKSLALTMPLPRDPEGLIVRPLAGGESRAEVLEPAGETGRGGEDGIFIADPTLATGSDAGRRLRSVTLAALAPMNVLRRISPAPAVGFSYFVARAADLLVVTPPLSTVRFLEAAGYSSVARLLGALRQRPYFRAIVDQPGPVRTPRWAGPYRDLFTGDATMAYAVPVEQGEALVGVVGVNLLLGRLADQLVQGDEVRHEVRLLTETGETLLARGADGLVSVAGLGRVLPPVSGVTAADLAGLSPGAEQPVEVGDWYLMARAVEGTPWRLVWAVPSGVVAESVRAGGRDFVLLLGVFILSVMAGILLIRRVLVRPMVEFIYFLDGVLSGRASDPPAFGEPWQLWASGVAAGFARNRDLTRQATERGDHLAALIRISIDAVVTFDGQGHILAFNPAAETMFGVRESEVIGRTLEQVIVPREDVATHRALMATLRQRGADAMPREIVERRLCRADDGRIFPAEIAVTGVEAGSDLLLTAYIRDISVRVEHERRIADLAFRDSRTGLPNRIGLLECIDAMLGERRSLVLAFLDLVQLGDVRLSFGHEYAEQVVCAFVERLRSHLPEGTRIARLGPSHLAVLGEGPGTDLLASIERNASEPLEAGGRTIALRCSVGATRVEAGRLSDPEAMLREAETAALMARLGSHPATVVLFDPGMLANLRRNAEIEQGLRHALSRSDELWIAFQPIISLAAGELESFEVLVRWNHRDFGAVSPVEFIPVAERTGLIFPLGRWIVQAAIDVLAGWARQCPPGARPPGLAINLSARQLSDPELEATITGRLAATGLDPALIELEITETTLLDGDPSVVDVLTRLRTLGVRIVVDDFGTGYSSLGYLRTLPVDVVKIDRSFVSNVGSDPAREAIVRAVTGLGHALGLRIVAEGIETSDEARIVRAIGCDLGQGFLFSRPVPAGEALDIVLARRRWCVRTEPALADT